MYATEVFTPGDYPSRTYVTRADDKAEQRLKNGLMTPGIVVSVSGPSKSGKTVLVKNVVTSQRLIEVAGATLTSALDLWDKILYWADVPLSRTTAAIDTKTEQDASDVGLTAGFAGSGISGKKSLQETTAAASSVAEERGRGGLEEVAELFRDSDFVVLIDDFHAVQPELQGQIARQLKAGAGAGIKFVVASVPSRADDVVRNNPDLVGRLEKIDILPWSAEELAQIALIGFPLVNLQISAETALSIADEACGAPQLMQSICLRTCFKLGVYKSGESQNVSFVGDDRHLVLEEVAENLGFADIVRQLHAGPSIRGTARITFNLTDGSTGDIYRASLLALRENPPKIQYDLAELSRRIYSVCSVERPTQASVSSAIDRLSRRSSTLRPGQTLIGWADQLITLDTYFLFYLRSSRRLDIIGTHV